MLPIAIVFLLFALTMGGLCMLLFSRKLWSREHLAFRERMEPKAVAGFLCFFIGIAVTCYLLLLPF